MGGLSYFRMDVARDRGFRRLSCMLISDLEQGANDVRADKPGSARDQDSHASGLLRLPPGVGARYISPSGSQGGIYAAPTTPLLAGT